MSGDVRFVWVVGTTQKPFLFVKIKFRKKLKWVSIQKIKILLEYLLLQKPRSRHHFYFDLV